MDPVDVCCGNNDGCSIGNDTSLLLLFKFQKFVFPLEPILHVRGSHGVHRSPQNGKIIGSWA